MIRFPVNRDASATEPNGHENINSSSVVRDVTPPHHAQTSYTLDNVEPNLFLGRAKDFFM